MLRKCLALSCVVLLAACTAEENDTPPATAKSAEPAALTDRPVDGQRIIDANNTPGEWLSHGRTYDEQRFSPLSQINRDSVKDLGLAWYADLPTRRGIEATPLMADGKLYVSGSWSHVYSYDAKTGELLWHFDPKVPKGYAINTCCDAINRGVALWGDKVYIGTLDGRMIALNRDTGKVVWEVDTRINTTDPYSITGAPRIVKGKVIIGNAGAEMAVRGYVTAYDAETGEQVWRFYTVPGNPADGFEDETQEWIAETWTGEWWKNGKGGGTAWDSFAFDPELNLLYIGVGNGSSWNQKYRSPEGGDNLFLSSIVAVDADTGEYVWHYQTTPGDSWDYTATQHMILAEIELGEDKGLRSVIMQAPKNGFFYVLDRKTGELLVAEKFIPVNWATHVDMETGRPVEADFARSGSADVVIKPGPSGAHNWHPMTYSPETGYVYIPAKIDSGVYADDPWVLENKSRWTHGYNPDVFTSLPDEMTVEERARLGVKASQAVLVVVDPSTGGIVWKKPGGFYSYSGLLSTKGGLLFQGDLSGTFMALDDTSGEVLWSHETQGGLMAPPISYEIDGEQYVAIVQGWGGETSGPFGALAGALNLVNISRVLVYKLGADLELPRVELVEQVLPEPNLKVADEASVTRGRLLYNNSCVFCHGGSASSSGLLPDLRYSINHTAGAWQAIVIDGALQVNGMPAWKEYFSAEDAEAIKSYVIHEAVLGHARGEKRLVRK